MAKKRLREKGKKMMHYLNTIIEKISSKNNKLKIMQPSTLMLLKLEKIHKGKNSLTLFGNKKRWAYTGFPQDISKKN